MEPRTAWQLALPLALAQALFFLAPLLLLAVPSVLIGYMTIEPMLFGDFFKNVIAVDASRHPAMAELAKAFHGPLQMALHGLLTAPFWLALAGVALAYYCYLVNPRVPAAIQRRVMPLYRLLEHKYFMDWINDHVVARGARALGTGLWPSLDVLLSRERARSGRGIKGWEVMW